MACIDGRMIPLKVLLFCFFGALGCLFPFLPLHMRSAGLSAEEARIVSMVAPAVSLLGPLAVGPLADRLASGLWGNSGAKGGSEKGGLKDYSGRTKGHRRLRALLASLILLSAVAYCLLLLVVPIVMRRDARTPQVTFRCESSASGGVVVQERCADQCHEWDGERVGSLVLTDCRYDCEEEEEVPEPSLFESETTATTQEEGELTTTLAPPPIAPPLSPVEASIDEYDDEEEEGDTEGEPPSATEVVETTTVATAGMSAAHHGKPSHLCFSGEDKDGKRLATCHAFYSPTNDLAINATLDGSLLGSGHDGRCIYPLSSFNLKGKVYSHLSCRPTALGRCRVVCSIDQPYNEVNSGPSLLGPSGSCPSMLGDPRLTFWSYLIVRSVADCFPAAAITILDATLLLPSPTSPGKQLAAGALGIAITSPVVAGLLAFQQEEWEQAGLSSRVFHYLPYPWPPFAAFSLLALVAVILLLIFPMSVLLGEEARKSRKVYKTADSGTKAVEPSPVLYSRKPRLRLGPYPPSRLSTHACEAAALFLVLVFLGMMWGGLDSYTSWYLSDLAGISDEENGRNVSTAVNETVDEFGLNGWLPPSPPPMMLLLLLGLMMTAGALPAMPLLWYTEKIIEICGHANLLIIAFTFYIVRYAVLSFVDDGWWALISEAVAAPISMGLAWSTAVHYTHLLCPPRLSATAQAVAVIAHFCIGRCIGAVIGAFVWAEFGLKAFLQGGALTAALVATVYFLVYHCCLKARCIGGGSGLRTAGSGGVAWGGRDSSLEGPTTNGNYTPLRVYHNGKGDGRKDRY